MSSKKRNLSASFNAVGSSSGSLSGSRPSSAKAGPSSSSRAGKSSARSTTSVESDLSDFLSITGARKVPQKSGQHKRTQSGSGQYSYTQGEVSGSESDQTSSSSGARRKTVNVNQQGNLRFAENHVPVILSQTKSKSKPRLATNFQVHNTATRSPSHLPNKPQGTAKNAAVNHTSSWWPSADNCPPVPPLELKSPSDSKPEHKWWPGSSGDPSPVNEYFSDCKADENWWAAMNYECNGDEKVLASWENTKSQDSKHASYKSDIPKLEGILDDSSADLKQHKAAVTIQRWVRGWIVRRQASHCALKELLSRKKQEKEKQMKWGQDNVLTEEQLREKKEKEKVKRREEKARLARQAAIEELQKQREEKRQENQRKVQEELQFLQASGKVTKKKANVGTRTKSKRAVSAGVGSGADVGTAQQNTKKRSSNGANATDESPRPGTASSVGRKVDEIFQESRTVKSVPNNAPYTEQESVSPVATDRTDKTVTRSDLEGGSKTTFDDLLESLKQLEEEPKDLLGEQKKATLAANWMRDFGDTQNDLGKPYLSVESLGQLDAPKAESSQGPQGTSLSAEKLRNILTFLDEVEKAEEDARSEINLVRDGVASHGLPSPSASTSVAADRERKEMALLESASAAASDVTQAMMAVKIELDEKKRTSDLLQRALNQQREFSLRQAKEMEKDAKVRIEIQRQEYEAAIQRHLSFIDQLIDDKKILSERCEELVKKLKEIDKKYSNKMKQMEENHFVETKKQKEVILAAEKLRREKWINEKTQQIKEVTVKGLEPDIQKLIAKHKSEFKRLKSLHQAELLEADERAGRRYIQQIEELRDQLEREKEMACSRERELAQQRYEKQLEQEEQAYQQQRRRLYAEVQEEKERLALQGQRQRQELDEARAALEDSHKKSALGQQSSFQKTLEDTERRHQLEVNELKERLEIEKQGWIENYMKKQDAVLLVKERELKDGVREARDREIEMVISRLEDETALTREECERAAENRIKRVRDKYESELKELEASEHNMQQKYNGMKERLTEVEGECSRLRSLFKQKGQETEDLDRVVKRLQEERGKVSDIIRQEFADRLVTTDEDNKRLKTEMSEMKARHRLEIERITREKEQEMEEVHKRVKQAIAKKEETMKLLREQQQAAMKRADHLEMLLQQQRKKLLP